MAAAQARDRDEIASILATSEDPQEVAAALTAQEALVDPAQCRDAWFRLVQSLSLEPTHDCAEVVGNSRRHFIALGSSPTDRGRWKEVEHSRVHAWIAPGVGAVRYPRHAEYDAHTKDGIDVFLDRNGNAWRSNGIEMQLSIPILERGRREHFVLPPGRPFRPVSYGGRLRVLDSFSVEPYDKVLGSPDAVPTGFVRAVAVILAGAR